MLQLSSHNREKQQDTHGKAISNHDTSHRGNINLRGLEQELVNYLVPILD